RVNEATILSTVRETYKVKLADIPDLPSQINKDNLRGFVTKTNIWEAITSNTWKDTDTVTATAYSYRSEESGKIVNYTDSFIGTDIFDTRQKAYYDTKVIEGGASRSVQVQETYFGQDANILDTFSYTYWVNVSDAIGATSLAPKSVKITENYIDMNGTSGIQDTGDNADTKFMESKYYTYYDSGKLILERFEGEKTKMVRASVEKRSTVRHPTNNRASTMTESTDPANLNNVIGLTYTWKEKGDALSSFMPDASKVYTVTESVVPTSVSTVISTEYTEKIYDKAYALGGVVTLTRVNEATILSTVRETYKVKPDDIEDLPLQINKDTLRGFVTKTNIWEAISNNIWKDTDSVTATAYSYRSEESGKIVNYTDSFIGTDIFDTRQKTYYASGITDVNSGKAVQVTENWIGSTIFEGFSYTYWGSVNDTAYTTGYKS
ncbi:MAG: hypothetical protein AAB113_05595, partial [Candidatus Eisenbacteria bacterium]